MILSATEGGTQDLPKEDSNLNMPWFVYIVQCRDNNLYTGITNNLNDRVQRHNTGRACRYTKYRWPVKLIHSEEYPTKPEALSREARIKRLPREKKLQLIKGKGGEVWLHS